ncbi:DEAD/DEAH box helicase [Mycoplasma mycoides subsp. capri]|uniref:DEAD/DEAH box helicase n=1 Tax=Mycoplasma mycoides TaxID=2102 RepID=UPI002240B569|nr:DEAD/DEAH box helicase [Mycoplasma mycoides]QVK02063.1 DEAD/DEAH box helicase [Mycoplasma mycoides subsp. capri]
MKNIEIKSIQQIRDSFIKEINNSKSKIDYINKNADNLFDLGLTMYSKDYSFNSCVYNAFSASVLDSKKSLHPEQIKILNTITKEKAIIFSAPTSFGKTFVVFEYIARKKPKNVVLVVPTLALVDEYKLKIIKKYKKNFENYKIFTSLDLKYDYNHNEYNLFILTHDRVVGHNEISTVLKKIDFLVIDEIYKLQNNENSIENERVLILNLAYKVLMKHSEKYVLLAPFLKSVKNMDKLLIEPKLISTDFSAVVNEIKEYPIDNKKQRLQKIDNILNTISDKSTLVYFPSVSKLNNYIKSSSFKINYQNENINKFIKWVSNEIHPEWNVVKCLKKGMLVHHGQIPLAFRIIMLSFFNNGMVKTLLCTSTLAEGINTKCEHIIITEPKIDRKKMDAFDFFNLIGRSGRMEEYYLGMGHYIRDCSDPIYNKENAIKSIEFELTSENSIDMRINSSSYKDCEEFVNFIDMLKISYEEYLLNVSNKIRFHTAKGIYERLTQNLKTLFERIDNLTKLKTNIKLIEIISKIVDSNTKRHWLNSFIINKLISRNYVSIKKTIDDTRKIFEKISIDELINITLFLKNSYIEHTFYKRLQIVLYFLELLKVDKKYIYLIKEKLINPIEAKYFINNQVNRELKDLGIYEKDIMKISLYLNLPNTFSINELLNELKLNLSKFETQISGISRIIILRLINK